MTKDTRLVNAEMRARALSRWEGEGGALAPTGAVDSIDESELRILARLGAALLDAVAWIVTGPAGAGHSPCEHARWLGDQARVKEKLSRFLHEHRNEC